MKNRKSISIIYRRNKIQSNNDTDIYVLEPVEMLNGIEDVYDGYITFTDEQNNCYPFVDDEDALNVEYVYSFPIYLGNNDIDEMTDEDLKTANEYTKALKGYEDHILYQSYSKKTGETKIYVSENGIKKDKIINPNCIKDLENVIKDPRLSEISSVDNEIYENMLKAFMQGMCAKGYSFVDADEFFSSPGLPDKKVSTPNVEIEKPKVNIIYADKLFEDVSKTVICQDEQIKKIATSVAKNQRLLDPSLKSNMLICGPTGVGKTEIFRAISKKTNLPITIEDSTEYTAASYKGKDVTEMLIHLYENANRDLERAQRGIVVVDEIDKKVSKGDHETYTTAVINSLLKMMEGQKYILQLEDKSSIVFDTSRLTFAFLGAFSGIEQYSNNKRNIGFMSTDDEQPTSQIYNNNTLIKYGLMPEFVGRNDNLIVMNALDVNELIRIAKESDKSQLLLYEKFFLSLGIKLIYDEKTLEEIAVEAKKLGIGARGIKRIVETALEVANYHCLSSNKYTSLTISPETIHDNKQYILK